jgi:hypothetical protein
VCIVFCCPYSPPTHPVGEVLPASAYQVTDKTLTILQPPTGEFELQVRGAVLRAPAVTKQHKGVLPAAGQGLLPGVCTSSCAPAGLGQLTGAGGCAGLQGQCQAVYGFSGQYVAVCVWGGSVWGHKRACFGEGTGRTAAGYGVMQRQQWCYKQAQQQQQLILTADGELPSSCLALCVVGSLCTPLLPD